MKWTASSRLLLLNPGFRRIWLVGLVASLSRWFEMIAVSVFVYELTGSPTKVGIVAAARWAPLMLLGPVTGLLGDIGDRRRIMLVVYAVMCAAATAMAIALALGNPVFSAIVATAFISGLGTVADFPVRRGLLADSVKAEQVILATGLDQSTNHAMRVIGPLISGGIYPLFGATGVYASLALFNLFSSLLLLGSAASERLQPRRWPSAIWRQAVLPPRALLADLRLWSVFGAAIVFNMANAAFIALIPVFAKAQLGASAGLIGLIAATEGLGATIGTFVVATIARPSSAFRWHYFGAAASLVLIFGLSFVEDAVFALAAGIGLGVAGACFGATQFAIVYNLAPEGMRSRAMGLLTIFIGFTALGSLNFGLMFDTFGVAPALRLIALELALPLVGLGVLWRLCQRSGDVG